MPGHVKRGGTGEPDPDPTPFLFVSYEQKQKDLKRVRKQDMAQTMNVEQVEQVCPENVQNNGSETVPKHLGQY